MILTHWRNYLRLHDPKKSVLDVQTHNLLVKELKKRIRRKQAKQIEEVSQLIYESHTLQEPRAIQKILERCYLQGLYRDHEEVRYFLRAEIKRWPSVSILDILNKTGPGVDSTTLNPKKLTTVKYPTKEERQIPDICKLMDIEDDGKTWDILPLEITGVRDKNEEKLNSMFEKILKLYHFIRMNTGIHSRHLKPLVATIPTDTLGNPIAECRQKNIIKKKISYIRNVIRSVPPLEKKDFDYLTSVLDGFYENGNPREGKLGVTIRREYKKFLRKRFTIDEDFNITLNKYAYIRALKTDRDYFFQLLENSDFRLKNKTMIKTRIKIDKADDAKLTREKHKQLTEIQKEMKDLMKEIPGKSGSEDSNNVS